MSKPLTLLSIAAATAMIAPSAYAAGVVAVDYILNSYVVMYVQMDGLRFGCF